MNFEVCRKKMTGKLIALICICVPMLLMLLWVCNAELFKPVFAEDTGLYIFMYGMAAFFAIILFLSVWINCRRIRVRVDGERITLFLPVQAVTADVFVGYYKQKSKVL